ncbi:carbohydrate kinase family protein [Candidatus Saccharibacteria bacterium]|nr:carbohydrate kinase family protein [Candidatus Saccharibacteria bacterium]
MKNVKVITIGSATQDVFLLDHDDFTTMRLGTKTIFNRLALGTKVLVDQAIQTTGGGGTNAAVTMARAGFRTAFIGSVGDDLAGKAVVQALEEDGVDTKFVRVRKNEGTGYTVLLLAPNGERTALVVKGASKTFAGINFAKIIADEKPDWVYVTTLSGDMKSLATIVKTAKASGTRVFLNPGDSEIDQAKELAVILNNVDILSVNTEEAELLLHKLRIKKGWKKYLDDRGKFNVADGVIVTDGPKGAIFSDGGKLYKVGVYSKEKSLDRTGAGDAFGSGFLAEYIRSDGDARKALIFASASSSSVVMRIGAKEGILSARTKLKDMPVVVKELKGGSGERK